LGTLQEGDLLWPAKPGAIIRFSDDTSGNEATRWQTELRRFAEKLRASENATDRSIAESIAGLTYAEFETLYFRGLLPGQPIPFAAGSTLSVGHVALVSRSRGGKKYIIEAIPSSDRAYDILTRRFAGGVKETEAAVWFRDHDDKLVWHGRLKGISRAEGSQIAQSAKQYLDRDYWFWSLDLADEQDFYCSKLVWRAASKAIGRPIDGNPAAKRNFWLSPKRLMLSPTIEMLHEPANYGR
jgi:hypothetical protein